MLRKLFESRFEVCEEAVDGQDAVSKTRHTMEAGDRYDVITMDYQMPVMDGPTATRTIREMGYGGIIIGITGNALQTDMKTFLEQGANSVHAKPLNIVAFDADLQLFLRHENMYK